MERGSDILLGRPKTALLLGSEDRLKLRSMARSDLLPRGVAIRAQIVLACAAGDTNKEIAERLGLSKTTVGKWRNRFLESGCVGLYDKPRSGKPPICDQNKMTALLDKMQGAMSSGAACHLSIRSLASEFGLSKSSVHRHLRKSGFQPSISSEETFTSDPFLFRKLRTVAGLYLNPPDNALILGVSKHVFLPSSARLKGLAADGRCIKEMSMLASALSVAPKLVRQKFVVRQRYRELLDVLKRVEETAADDLDIWVVGNNTYMCAHPKIETWLNRPRWFVHVISALDMWQSFVERVFQTIGGSGDYRGQIYSEKEIARKIALFIAGYEKHTRPFIWTKPTRDFF
jgi:putative transposase